MRAWPAKFDGLRLRLSAGWYSLPSYIGADERRLLIAVLSAGIAEVDHIVELDWEVLEEAADKLQLTRSLVFVRVPADVEPDGEALQRVRATLGSVRLGLLQYEAAGVWADVAWQEREVKAPLLTWLKRWLRNQAHPFAKLGVAELPIDEIAKLTAEPVELLMMAEMVIRHRLRYRQQGMGKGDWARSVMHVAAERLAGRVMQIPKQLRSRALDLAMSGADVSVVAAIEDRDAALALARVGLAWHEGNDLLLGPLVSLVGEVVVRRRLLELLPEQAWSQQGKQLARACMPPVLPPPRASTIAPYPANSSWPAIVPDFPDLCGDDLRELQWILDDLPDILSADPEHDLATIREKLVASKVWSQCPLHLQTAIEASLAMLAEIDQERLLELDFERGRLHRFDAVDRAWTGPHEGEEVRAYFRWLGVSRLLERAHTQRRLEVLSNEVDSTVSLVHSATPLCAALWSLQGDILARQDRCQRALECWNVAEQTARDCGVEHLLSDYRLALRRMLMRARLDEVVVVEELDDRAFDALESHFLGWEVPEDVLAHGTVLELVQVAAKLQAILESGVPDAESWAVDVPPGSNALRITRIAAALEYGDWPHAIGLAKHLDPDLATAEGIRAELLRAWITASLGDLDHAHATFTDLLQLTTERGDTLTQAFAHRGLAGVAYLRNQTDFAITSLEAAVNLERELELSDAELLDLELVGWRVLAGQLTLEAYNAKLANFDASSASPSLEFARLDAFLRFLGSARTVIQTTDTETLRVAMHPFIAVLSSCVRLRKVSPRVGPACEVAVELAASLAEAGMHEQAKQVREAVQTIAPSCVR